MFSWFIKVPFSLSLSQRRPAIIQPGFFDLQDRLHKIDKNGDPLTRLNETVNWEMFRPALEKTWDTGPKSNVGAKGYDVILLFKILILQSLYNLSDDATEYQILDRHSFGRFLGLHISQKVLDATTVRLFREDLSKAGIVEELFAIFASSQ
jgi:Transposase and inactivated derivatives, IS5 family